MPNPRAIAIGLGTAAAIGGGALYMSQPSTDPNGPIPDPYVIRWTQNQTVDGMCFIAIRAGAFNQQSHNVAVQMPSTTVQLPATMTEQGREQALLAALNNPPTKPRHRDLSSRSNACLVEAIGDAP